MNVYVRELVSSLAQAGVECTVYVRRWHDELPVTVDVEPGFRVVHVSAGPSMLEKEALPGIVDDFTDAVIDDIRRNDDIDALHANYWLSGVAGHRIKHELDLPLVSIFHTLARVKAETGDAEPQRRVDAETAVIGCSDVILANSHAEAQQLVSYYGADPARVEIVPPGVDHALFSPGVKAGARAALGLGDHPVLLFVGRIQPLKGADVAVRALHELGDPTATLLVVGGASGREGEAEVTRVRQLVRELHLEARVRFLHPQPHHELSTYYRAADVCLVPSRSESFGLRRGRRVAVARRARLDRLPRRATRPRAIRGARAVDPRLAGAGGSHVAQRGRARVALHLVDDGGAVAPLVRRHHLA
jgi:D-inositol-3-phosphate glycosyltransferase